LVTGKLSWRSNSLNADPILPTCLFVRRDGALVVDVGTDSEKGSEVDEAGKAKVLVITAAGEVVEEPNSAWWSRTAKKVWHV
jgi:hypothetical protein